MKAGIVIISTAVICILAISTSAAPIKIDFTNYYYQGYHIKK